MYSICRQMCRLFFRWRDRLANRISTRSPPFVVAYLSRFLPGFDECIGTHAETLLRTRRSPWSHISRTGFKGQSQPNKSISKNVSLSLRKIQLHGNSRLSLSSRRSATNEVDSPGKYNRLARVQRRLRSTPGSRPVWERWGPEPNLRALLRVILRRRMQFMLEATAADAG